MELIIRENSAGCWYDGSHQSSGDLNWAIIQIMNGLIEKAYNDEKLLFNSDANDEWISEIADEAINFVNSEICGDSDYSADGALQFEIYENSLFLTDTRTEN